jgi:SAM-dependent methyltransferase
MMQRFKLWCRSQKFHPGPLGWLLNPFYFARVGLRKGMKELGPHLRGRILDVGCGSKPYRELIAAEHYVGMEIDTPQTRTAHSADVYYDGMNFPVGDAEFDGVLCSQVFEHVFTPDLFLAEVNRVLRPNGILLLTVPFVWDEHEQPYDFARYSSFGLKSVLEKAGFELVEHRKTVADIRVLFQLLNAYLFKVTRTRSHRINQLIVLGMMAPVSLVGIVVNWVTPTNIDLYLDNIVLARKKSGRGL